MTTNTNGSNRDMNSILANQLASLTERPSHVPLYGTPRRSKHRRGQRVVRVIR